MSFLKRLFGSRTDDLSPYRPLWHRIVALARDPRWYADAGVEDSVPGRFDAVTLVLVAVMLRMEREPALIEASVRLTELFVSDMDGQLRQSGVGDLVVGKRMGKLMGVLGGRLGAYREGLAKADDTALTAAVGRNVTLLAGAKPDAVAAMLRHFAGNLAACDSAALLAGEIEL
ncbi:MAG: ubiquinol-cytochrome C chaperone family protein [Novosphingobium sp.]